MDGNARAQFGNQYHTYYGSVHQSSPLGAASKDDKDEFNISAALSFDGMDVRRATIKSAYGNTCQWFFNSEEYKRWRDDYMLAEHHGFLWIRGKPGAGKSTLMKCAVKHAQESFPDDELKTDFFFSVKGAPLERSIEGVYRSVLYQLLIQRPDLKKFFKNPVWTQQTWPRELLKETLHDIVLSLRPDKLTCHIDALDECDESDVRDMVDFFEEVGSSAVASGVKRRVCLASRHYPRISISRCVHAVLDELTGHQQDIETYVRNGLKISSPTLRSELAHEIRRRARDVFLWVVLVVRLLNKESDRGNDHKLRICLEQIPDGVRGLIEDAILARGDDDSENLVPILIWILFAARPLTPCELYHAVLHTNEDATVAALDGSNIKRSQIDAFILHASKGLAEVVPTNVRSRYRVQFIHETVREFLSEGGMSGLNVSISRNLAGTSHDIICRTCVKYMSIAADLPTPSKLGLRPKGFRAFRSQNLEAYPLSVYVLINVIHHAELAQTHGVSQTSFTRNFSLELMTKLTDFFEDHVTDRCFSFTNKTYLFASSNAPQLCQLYLSEKRGGTENEPNATATPRSLAINDAFRSVREGSHALQAAIFNRDVASAETLLHHGVDVNAQGGPLHTALQAAASLGSEDMVKLLLEFGADTNAQGGRNHTALMAAVFSGSMDVVKLLLEHGADVNTKREGGTMFREYFTAIQAAVSQGKKGIVRLLLERGADVDFRGRGSHSAMETAFTRGDMKMVELLLEYRADM